MLLESQIGPNEHILWSGTKNKKVSVMEAIFNPMLPFAAIWGLVDFGFIFMMTGTSHSGSSGSAGKSFLGFMIPFFLLHLMPGTFFPPSTLRKQVSHGKAKVFSVEEAS